MGNVQKATDELFKEYESSTGKMLLRGIRNNNQQQVADAVDFARKQLAQPNLKKNHEEDYRRMTEKMTAYLTRRYDVGDGVLHWKTPVDFAESLGSHLVIEYLKDTIYQLGQKVDRERTVNVDKAPAIKAAVGTVDSDRVSLAKARLKEFRDKK